MMRSICAIALLLISMLDSHSQGIIEIGGIQPQGAWKNYWNFGLGGNLLYAWKSDFIILTSGIGYYKFSGNTIEIPNGLRIDTQPAELVPFSISIHKETSKNLYLGFTTNYTFAIHDTKSLSIITGSAQALDDGFLVVPKIGYALGRLIVEGGYSPIRIKYWSISVGVIPKKKRQSRI
ncbi:MAG: hypothetical protein RIF46_09495 [Cyclobacteriaceae bacterium]